MLQCGVRKLSNTSEWGVKLQHLASSRLLGLHLMEALPQGEDMAQLQKWHLLLTENVQIPTTGKAIATVA